MHTPKTPFIWDEAQARHLDYLQAVEQWQLERAVLVPAPPTAGQHP